LGLRVKCVGFRLIINLTGLGFRVIVSDFGHSPTTLVFRLTYYPKPKA